MFKVTVSYCFSSQDTSLFLLEESTFPELPTLIKVPFFEGSDRESSAADETFVRLLFQQKIPSADERES